MNNNDNNGFNTQYDPKNPSGLAKDDRNSFYENHEESNVQSTYDPKNPNDNYDPSDETVDRDLYEKKWRKWNNLRPVETPANIYYGVDINDKKAVKRRLAWLKFKHFFVTIFSLAILAVLGVIIFEFYRVNFLEQHPILAIKKRVDGGYLYEGLGYKSLYCDDGTKYTVYSEYTSCTDNTSNTYKDILFKAFKEYAFKNELLNEAELVSIDLVSYEFDETTYYTYTDVYTGDEVTEEYNHYLTQFSLACTDGSGKCIKFGQDYNDLNDVKVILKVNKDNKVEGIDTFRTSGAYYDKTREDLIPKVRQYLIDNGYVTDEEQLRYFKIDITQNHGKYKYNGNYYANSYVITVYFLCQDNGNTCINYNDFATSENLSFDISIFLNENGEIETIGKSVAFDI